MWSPLCITIYSMQSNKLLQNTVEVTEVCKLTSQKCITSYQICTFGVVGGGIAQY